MRMAIQQLWPGNRAPGEWKTVGHATTLTGASRVAKRHHDPRGFGGFRHPDGGPQYGTIRAVDGDRILWWDPVTDTWHAAHPA